MTNFRKTRQCTTFIKAVIRFKLLNRGEYVTVYIYIFYYIKQYYNQRFSMKSRSQLSYTYMLVEAPVQHALRNKIYNFFDWKIMVPKH